MTDLLVEARRTIALISEIPTAATLSVVGLVLMAFACGALYRTINSEGEPQVWLKFAMAVALLCGILFSVAAPAIALLDRAGRPIELASKDEIFANLRTNARVSWLIRLIPYYPDEQPSLAVSSLRTLGPPALKYVFVGAYEELKGRTVEQAIAMLGGNFQRGQRVSAVIFAVSGRYPIFPASSRGLLQVVKKIEENPAAGVQNRLIKDGVLNSDELSNLANEEVVSWSFPSYRDHFRRFCNLTHKLRCEKAAFDVSRAISSINSDWHPAGAATTRQTDPCQSAPQVCGFQSWEQITDDIYESFGARVFLMENKPIAELSNRYLIDFENPSNQLIPEIGNVDARR